MNIFIEKLHTCFGKCKKYFLVECDEGKFGLGCTELCGNCRLSVIEEMEDWKCHHVDGYCIYGCNPGYYGDRCLQRNLLTYIIGIVQVSYHVYRYV